MPRKIISDLQRTGRNLGLVSHAQLNFGGVLRRANIRRMSVLGVCSVEPSGAVEPGLADVMADRLATHDKRAADGRDVAKIRIVCKDRRC